MRKKNLFSKKMVFFFVQWFFLLCQQKQEASISFIHALLFLVPIWWPLCELVSRWPTSWKYKVVRPLGHINETQGPHYYSSLSQENILTNLALGAFNYKIGFIQTPRREQVAWKPRSVLSFKIHSAATQWVHVLSLTLSKISDWVGECTKTHWNPQSTY